MLIELPAAPYDKSKLISFSVLRINTKELGCFTICVCLFSFLHIVAFVGPVKQRKESVHLCDVHYMREPLTFSFYLCVS